MSGALQKRWILCKLNSKSGSSGLGIFEPFASRCAVVVPAKSGMCAQDIKTAPNEKWKEKKIEEVGCSQS
jgi:hypothetical protein